MNHLKHINSMGTHKEERFLINFNKSPFTRSELRGRCARVEPTTKEKLINYVRELFISWAFWLSVSVGALVGSQLLES